MHVAASELDLTKACVVRARRENPQQKMAADDLVKHLELITGVKPKEGAAVAGGAAVVFSFRRPKLRGQALQGARFLWGWSLGTGPAKSGVFHGDRPFRSSGG